MIKKRKKKKKKPSKIGQVLGWIGAIIFVLGLFKTNPYDILTGIVIFAIGIGIIFLSK